MTGPFDRMDLYATPGNPIPPGANLLAVRTRDGRQLRTARWVARNPRGTVIVAMGRSEFIEEYYEVVAALLARNFDVVAWDWRGQGASDRECRRPRRGHVRSFAGYRRDLDAIEQQILKPVARKPWFALGHSMGAAILIDQAHDGRSPYERLVLTAPMIGVPLRAKRAVRRVARIATWLGFGQALIPGGAEDSAFVLRTFDNNILTSDLTQYKRLEAAIGALPAFVVGAPTMGWLDGACRLMARFERPRYPVEVLTPILIVAAGDDSIVDTRATERFARRLKAGRCFTIPHARHQVHMETPEITAQFWAAFDAFIPGNPVEVHAHPAPIPHAVPEPRPVRMPRARTL